MIAPYDCFWTTHMQHDFDMAKYVHSREMIIKKSPLIIKIT